MSQEILTMVYDAYFHSIMNYRLIFLEKCSHSANIFKIQKNIIRFTAQCRNSD